MKQPAQERQEGKSSRDTETVLTSKDVILSDKQGLGLNPWKRWGVLGWLILLSPMHLQVHTHTLMFNTCHESFLSLGRVRFGN